MEKRRVVITGMGVVAPNGIVIENFRILRVQPISANGSIFSLINIPMDRCQKL